MFETTQTYEARAYTFQGLKSEERKYRMRHLKRCQGNRFCYQFLEQGGRKWVISSYGSREEETVLTPSPSPHASYKETALISSGDKRKPSGLQVQDSTTEAPEQLNWESGRTGNQTSKNVQSTTQGYLNVPRAIRLNFTGWTTLSDANTPVAAADSATASSNTSGTNGQEPPIVTFPYNEEKAGDSAFKTRKQEPKIQLERRKERRRRAQQVRRMMNSDKQNLVPQPRVFMQWEKSEVRRLLHKQESTLQSAYQAELQKLELTLRSTHKAELQKQELALHSTHEAQLQELRLALNSAHQEELGKQRLALNSSAQEHRDRNNSMLWACRREEAGITDIFRPEPYDIRKKLCLVEHADDNVLSVLEDLLHLPKSDDVPPEPRRDLM